LRAGGGPPLRQGPKERDSIRSLATSAVSCVYTYDFKVLTWLSNTDADGASGKILSGQVEGGDESLARVEFDIAESLGAVLLTVADEPDVKDVAVCKEIFDLLLADGEVKVSNVGGVRGFVGDGKGGARKALSVVHCKSRQPRIPASKRCKITSRIPLETVVSSRGCAGGVVAGRAIVVTAGAVSGRGSST
jgi:hypothetical protein